MKALMHIETAGTAVKTCPTRPFGFALVALGILPMIAGCTAANSLESLAPSSDRLSGGPVTGLSVPADPVALNGASQLFRQSAENPSDGSSQTPPGDNSVYPASRAPVSRSAPLKP